MLDEYDKNDACSDGTKRRHIAEALSRDKHIYNNVACSHVAKTQIQRLQTWNRNIAGNYVDKREPVKE